MEQVHAIEPALGFWHAKLSMKFGCIFYFLRNIIFEYVETLHVI